MREALVIVPSYTPTGRSTWDARKAFGIALAATFGGYTKAKAFGADPTTPKGEQVWLYTVAMDDTADNATKLARLSLAVWNATEQQFGYVRFASGDVELVDVRKSVQTGLIRLGPGRLVPATEHTVVTSEAVGAWS